MNKLNEYIERYVESTVMLKLRAKTTPTMRHRFFASEKYLKHKAVRYGKLVEGRGLEAMHKIELQALLYNAENRIRIELTRVYRKFNCF